MAGMLVVAAVFVGCVTAVELPSVDVLIVQRL
jgi:hypothetical protein